MENRDKMKLVGHGKLLATVALAGLAALLPVSPSLLQQLQLTLQPSCMATDSQCTLIVVSMMGKRFGTIMAQRWLQLTYLDIHVTRLCLLTG